MVQKAQVIRKESTEKKLEEGERPEISKRVKLLIDATVAPADIKYPTDVDLLNTVRKDTEKIIDTVYAQQQGKGEKKPRTDRSSSAKRISEICQK